MAFSLSSLNDSEGDLDLLNELQDSEGNETQSEGLIGGSDEEYLPENDSEASSSEIGSDGSGAYDERPRSLAVLPSLHTFSLI